MMSDAVVQRVWLFSWCCGSRLYLRARAPCGLVCGSDPMERASSHPPGQPTAYYSAGVSDV
jgi:hypothetical protein